MEILNISLVILMMWCSSMLNKKILILSIFLISLVSCSSKSSFTDLKAHTDMEKTLKEPISKKSIDEKIFKDEKKACCKIKIASNRKKHLKEVK